MEIFLLSNGKLPDDEQLLGYAKERLKVMFTERNIRSAVFVGYAVIRASHSERAKMLEAALGIKVICIEDFDSPVQAIEQAECILVSGGNTWLLNQQLHEKGLIIPIQRAVRERHVPYIGWSAGSNVATPSIRTTNDMPVSNAVVMPALGLFPVQINPHYIDSHISGLMGETRDERIAEFCAINPDEIVIGLREGSGFHIKENELHYFSSRNEGFKLFQHNKIFPEQFNTQVLDSWVPFHCN
ncbi:dipeptidase PepE [Xenorhabdus sp. 12]|uniref:Dipeptidase PepE n=1 Tax=Xenorhabdus santafensis TaxID=2582833 RepID=A0ABU4SCK5_9GAMM|nr:dipeptidase PepE [Xenorhabdus sp. 12]MDX7988532.1 dipeptidase PepE [Xenorhabdus sp. 12]